MARLIRLAPLNKTRLAQALEGQTKGETRDARGKVPLQVRTKKLPSMAGPQIEVGDSFFLKHRDYVHIFQHKLD